MSRRTPDGHFEDPGADGGRWAAGTGGQSDSKPSSTKERLIAAARIEFAEHGLRGAATKNIALAAEVSEVTLFRHFATKKNLFTAVLEGFSGLSVFDDELKSRLTWNLETDLKMIGTAFLQMTDASTLAMLTSITEAIRHPEIRELVAAPPRRQLEFMTWYFEEQIKRGTCRKLLDVKQAAQAFTALFFEHSVGKAVYVEDPPKPAEAVKRLVELFLHGVARG